MRRHIDIFAVCLIALVMGAFSQARTLAFGDGVNVIRVQNASYGQQSNCVGEQILADLASFLNQ